MLHLKNNYNNEKKRSWLWLGFQKLIFYSRQSPIYLVGGGQKGLVHICPQDLKQILLLPLLIATVAWSNNICMTNKSSGSFSPGHVFLESSLMLVTVAEYQNCCFSFSSVNGY